MDNDFEKSLDYYLQCYEIKVKLNGEEDIDNMGTL